MGVAKGKYAAFATIGMTVIALIVLLAFWRHAVQGSIPLKVTAEQGKALEMATPAQIAEMYYRALDERDWNLAMAALSRDYVSRYGEKEILAGMKAITGVSNVTVKLERTISPDRIRFMVTFHQESQKQALGVGNMTRFVDVVRQSVGAQWQIDNIASSP
jgi:limonene-1,2-epoxide hydrolase